MTSQSTSASKVVPQFLVRGCGIVSATTGAAMLLGGALLLTVQPRQEVGAKILVEPRSALFEVKSASAREKEFLPTQAEVLSSPAVIAAAVRQTAPDLADADVAVRVSAVAAELKVDPLAGTNILLVRYTDETGQRAAELVNALIDGYREYLAAAERKQQQEVLVSLTARDQEHLSALATLQSEYELLTASRGDSAVADSDTSARILAGLEVSLANAQCRRLLLERAAEQFHGRSNTRLSMASPPAASSENSFSMISGEHLPRIDDHQLALLDLQALSSEPWIGIPDTTELEAKKTEAQRRVGELTVALGPHHPELLAARSAVARYEQDLQQLVQTLPTRVQVALDGIRSEEETLQQRFETHLHLAREAELMRQREARKLEEIDRARQFGETLKTQLQHWQSNDRAVAGSPAGISVTVLEPPIPAARSFAANPLIVMGITGLLGLLFGVALLVLLPQISSLLPALTRISGARSGERLFAQEARS